MNKIYGVNFKENGKIYYYSFEDSNLKVGDNVVTLFEIGERLGKVQKIVIKEKDNDDIDKILRKATLDDLNNYMVNKEESKKALDIAKNLVKKQNLNMHILSSEFDLNRKKLLFNFIANERVDFRQLAKALANKYRIRIELHQIGIRDKAKEIGGVGQCGRCLCCSSFLSNINSISINTVKNQNLAINPSKINGQCGRLLCCLTYEDEEYKKCQNILPHVGDFVDTDYGKAQVISLNILEKKYIVLVDGVKKEISL